MWRTSEGERVLCGAEWTLFQTGLARLWKQLEANPDGGHRTGVWVFDELEPPARIALLAEVGRALRDEKVPCPELTAVNEGAVAAVFACLRRRVLREINHGASIRWRQRIRAAYLATLADPHDPAPEAESIRRSRWIECLETLADRILWDRDFEMGELFLDAAPEHAEYLREHLNIDENYFTAIADEPKDASLHFVRQTLLHLTEI
jgi:hypothetical protein